VFYGVAGSEARAMEGRDVFVVGAGNSAGQAALHLARHARQVRLLVRGNSLEHSMSEYLVREIGATPAVTVCPHTEVADGHGEDRLESLTLRDRPTGQARQVAADALFVLIGGEPRTGWLPETFQLIEGSLRPAGVARGAGGGPSGCPLEPPPLPLETSVPGVFAAGD